MKVNEKGFTLIELMVSMLILIITITAALQFYDTYKYEKGQYGEYITAKNLAVKALEEQRQYFLTTQDVSQQTAYENVVRVNGIDFNVTVKQKNETNQIAHVTNNIPFVQLISTVEWRLRKVEVDTYVSAH